MKKTTSFIIGLFAVANGLFAQTSGGSPMSALNSGDISTLTDVRTVNIVYTYNDLGVGAFRKEEDYLAKKCDDIAKKPKEGASCEKFRKDWADARKTRFEPRFELLFNKYGEKSAFMTGTNYSSNQDVTLEIHTVFIEPGYNIGISKKPAFVDLECTFKDKSGKVLCVIFLKNAIGSQAMGYDFDVNSRIVESYSMAAKMLTGLIKKERKKKKIKIAK